MSEPKDVINIYLWAFSTVFAVMFGLFVTQSQQNFRAFHQVPLRWPKLFLSTGLIIVPPAVIFIVALLTIVHFPQDANWNLRWYGATMFLLLYWVTAVYGCQQLWLVIYVQRYGRPLHADFEPGTAIWWVVLFLIGPLCLLTYFFVRYVLKWTELPAILIAVVIVAFSPLPYLRSLLLLGTSLDKLFDSLRRAFHWYLNRRKPPRTR